MTEQLRFIGESETTPPLPKHPQNKISRIPDPRAAVPQEDIDTAIQTCKNRSEDPNLAAIRKGTEEYQRVIAKNPDARKRLDRGNN